MSYPAFKGTFKRGDKGLDVAGVKRTLRELGFKRVKRGRTFGVAAVAALQLFQEGHHLKPDGIYGPQTHAAMAPLMKGYALWLYKKAPARSHPKQDPALPKRWPASVYLVDNGGGSGRYGLQSALVPQVDAICTAFNLKVTAGYGGHPPHAYNSDHRVGLAVDLAGSQTAMVNANLWADGLRGHVFRWVGGPAHDADGAEPGHSTHVHLSWFRSHPTTIFGTSKFKES